MTTLRERFDNAERLIAESRDQWTPEEATEVDARLAAVAAAFDDSSTIRGRSFLGFRIVDAEDCQDWATAQGEGSTYANAQYWAWCDDWEYGVDQALTHLGDYLDELNEPDLAEVIRAIAENVQDSGVRADVVVPDTFEEWWRNTPTITKVGIPLLILAYLWYAPRAAGAAYKAST